MLKLLKHPPAEGDEKIVKKFAFLPIYEIKQSDGKYYFCWWEHYYVKQKYVKQFYPQTYGDPEESLNWVIIDRWI